MALAQRPGPRCLAALHRWSRHTPRSSLSVFSSHNPQVRRRLGAVANTRTYHATRRLHEDESIHDFLQQGSATDAAQLKDHVRRLMRQVPASVAVITVAHRDPESESHVPMGIAVSSLNTVTLDPPTVSFNIKEPSKALDAIRAADGRFRVHFLEGTPLSRIVIEHFCQGNHPAAYQQRKDHLEIHVPQSGASAPQLRGESIHAAAECTLTQEMPVGDHVILVAQINALEKKQKGKHAGEPTVAYVDGTYRSLQSASVIGHHGAPQKQPIEQTAVKHQSTDQARELAVVHDYPLFPGQQDRHEYAERLKAYFNGFEIGNIKKFVRHLAPQTKSISSAFGIDLESLLYLCKTGEPMKNRHILPEFYGQLSAAQLAKLVNRATAMVKADARFLNVGYIVLLRYLNAQLGSISLLPSDILNPLRAEGLVAPFQEDLSMLQAHHRREQQVPNILYMEQSEHALRKHLLTLTDREILHTPLSAKLEQAGVNPRDIVSFLGPHTRLTVESCSGFYKNWKLDITGHVTPEEARVVVQRLLTYLNIERPDLFKIHMREEVRDMMRNSGVHPLVTGIDATLLISKLRHLHSTAPSFWAFKQKVEEWVQPHFASSVTWEDLSARIAAFVHKFPLQATRWKTKDVLPAMGLRGTTTLTTALSCTPQTLDESGLVETLVAKALKAHYGKGSAAENEAIARFLQTQYGFDVVSKTAVATPEEAMARSSADDLEVARRANEEVVVPIRTPGK